MKDLLVLLVAIAIVVACGNNRDVATEAIKPLVNSKINNVDWVKDAVIYEVNLRQYTAEGSFKAFTQEIPRLKDLGVDILWLMPIHPIGQKNRKGSLGSYYSIKNYGEVNPEFGSKEDFRQLIEKAHSNGMYVLLDWVANHTAWDHIWLTEHPDWYAKDSTGNFYGPFDWSDVAQLNYQNNDLRAEMTNEMEYWVREFDIDGFRCDVAGMVPQAFWEATRKKLDAIKPVFMLAEDEAEYMFLENAFDMNYGWEFHHIMNKLAKGDANVNDVKKYFRKSDSIYAKNCLRMHFITNHDENSWNGTEYERLGDGVKTFALLSFTVPGMPLLYSGQEYGLNKRLEFFEKDTIDANSENEYTAFYKSLINLKKSNPLLWNGLDGGNLKILNAKNKNVLCFMRFTDEKELFVVLNLSPEKQTFTAPLGLTGAYKEYFKGTTEVLTEGDKIILKPWEYKVYIE